MLKLKNVLGQLTLSGDWSDAEFSQAQRVCAKQGYRDSFAYITSDALPGLKCIPVRPNQPPGFIVKTVELGFLFILDCEDI